MYCYYFIGTYYYYGSVDDLLTLYGQRVYKNTTTHTETLLPEELLLTATYSNSNMGQYYKLCSDCAEPSISKGIYLLRGERYRLRARFVNLYSYDQVEIAMKIRLDTSTDTTSSSGSSAVWPTSQPLHSPTPHPTYIQSSIPTIQLQSKAPTKTPTFTPTLSTTYAPTRIPTNTPSRKPSFSPTLRPTAYPTYMPTYTSEQYNGTDLPIEVLQQDRNMNSVYLQQHSLKDVQLVALGIPFQYEIQVKCCV